MEARCPYPAARFSLDSQLLPPYLSRKVRYPMLSLCAPCRLWQAGRTGSRRSREQRCRPSSRSPPTACST